MISRDKYELIILIDDNDNTLFLNKDIVEDFFLNPKIITFNNPSKFLSEITELQNEFIGKWLVIMDLNMPEYSGYELIEHLEDNDYEMENIEIIILTSSNAKADIEKSKVYRSIIGYLSKPISFNKLEFA